MEVIPAVLALLMVAVMYAGLAKLAARLYRRSRLTWKSAFAFGALTALVLVVGTVLGNVLPDAATVVVGFGLAVAVGAWFLRSRATDQAGQVLGLQGAAALSAIAVGIAFALGIALAILLPSVAPQ